MDSSKTSTAEEYARKIRRPQKKDLDPMSGIGARQTNTHVRLTVDPNGNRLDTWKEIAVYLARAVRTAQRWHKSEGLPVHRHFHAKASTVYAFKHEVDAWLQKRRWTGERPENKESTEPGVDWLLPRAGGERMLTRSGSWSQNASGMGSIDLLYGENQLRLHFYVQLREERSVSSAVKRSRRAWLRLKSAKVITRIRSRKQLPGELR